MNKAELIQKLNLLAEDLPDTDTEQNHIDADNALIAFINDPEIWAAYSAITKWYA